MSWLHGCLVVSYIRMLLLFSVAICNKNGWVSNKLKPPRHKFHNSIALTFSEVPWL